MKLNFGRRLVLFIHWLLSLALCALGVALFIWPDCRAAVAGMLGNTSTLVYAICMLIVYLLFAAGSVAIICGGRKGGEDRNFIIVDSSETGRTRIAVGAVEQMIRQAVRGVPGVAEMKAGIVNNEDSILINADIAILNGTHVPTVTANIRRAIRGYIEQNCGVAVRGVSVNVHSLADEQAESGRRGRKKKTGVGNSEKQTPVWNAPASDPIAEPEPVPEPEPEAIELKLPDEPEPEPMPEPEPEPVESPVEVEAPVEVAAPKKGKRFGRFFGRRGSADASEATSAEAPAEEALEAGAEAVAAEEISAEPVVEAEAVVESPEAEDPERDGEV